MKKLYKIVLIFSMIFYSTGCKEESKDVIVEEKETVVPTAPPVTVNTADYEIVKIEDQSRKALGKRSLSQYTQSELEKLPINKKILYRIVLSKEIKENQIEPTVEGIVNKLTSEDSEIDEIILWLYSDKDISNSTFNIGTAIWAPNGELGNINANIAENNHRDSYKISYQLKDNLEEYLALKSVSEVKSGLPEELRKQIFKEIVKAEDRANEFEQSEQDKVLAKFGSVNNSNREKIIEEYDKINEEAQKLMNQYKSTVFKKYNITEPQAKEISSEGLEKYWPME